MRLTVKVDRGIVSVVDADTGEGVEGVVKASLLADLGGVMASMAWRVMPDDDARETSAAPILGYDDDADDDDSPGPRRAL